MDDEDCFLENICCFFFMYFCNIGVVNGIVITIYLFTLQTQHILQIWLRWLYYIRNGKNESVIHCCRFLYTLSVTFPVP